MPMYDFACPACGRTLEQYANMAGSHERMICPCGAWATRIYANVQVNPGSAFTPGYNPGLGINCTTRQDIKDAQRRYYDTHGTELIELGNEKSWKATPIKSHYPSAKELGIS